MATFYALGNYTTQGFQGFIKDPKSDRAKAAQAAAQAVGAKLVSYTGLRGPYDFLAVFEGTLHKVLELKWQRKLAALFVILQFVKQLTLMKLQQTQQKLQGLIKVQENNFIFG